jgi:hypothetical protein
MDTGGKNENELDAVLREVYESTEPADSWEALRGRIDGAIGDAKPKEAGGRRLLFSMGARGRWAMAAAACVLVGLSIVCYQVGIKTGESQYREEQLHAASSDLFTEVRLSQLHEAFSQVRPLFSDELPWIMVGEGNNVQIGVNGPSPNEVDTGHVIVIRLTVNMDGREAERQYFDIVTFANHRAELLLPLASDMGVHVRLMPRLSREGIIDLEIDASVNGGAHAQNTGRIVDDSFIPLVRMRADGGWLNINGTGRATSGS